MILLGLDYGKKRIGLALSVDSIIEPMGFIENKGNESLEKIKRLCQEENVDKVLIGLSSGSMGLETKKFGDKLGEILDKPIDWVDESLTSKEAEKIVGWKNKGKVDSISAALILKRYLGI